MRNEQLPRASLELAAFVRAPRRRPQAVCAARRRRGHCSGQACIQLLDRSLNPRERPNQFPLLASMITKSAHEMFVKLTTQESNFVFGEISTVILFC